MGVLILSDFQPAVCVCVCVGIAIVSICRGQRVGDPPGVLEAASGGAGGLNGRLVPESGSSPW